MYIHIYTIIILISTENKIIIFIKFYKIKYLINN